MRKQEIKELFVINYLKNKSDTIDILNTPFMDLYIDTFKPEKWSLQFSGAPMCPEVGRLLSSMYKKGILRRHSIGLSEMGVGWPKWIYVYSLRR